jgi:hypothetical protein
MDNLKTAKSLEQHSSKDDIETREDKMKQCRLSTLIGDLINCDGMSPADAAIVVSKLYADMSLSRHGENKRFHLKGLAWQTALHVAVLYGWEPLGTVKHQSVGWDGSYVRSEKQTITDKDAANLGDALSKSVIDRFRRLQGTHVEIVLNNRKASTKYLKRVICYIRRGSFDIAKANWPEKVLMIAPNRSLSGDETLH